MSRKLNALRTSSSLSPSLPLLYVLSFFCTFSLSVEALAQPGINRENTRKQYIDEVIFEGNEHISEGELAAVILSQSASGWDKAQNWFNSNWGLPQQYVDRLTMEHDTAAILQYYQNNGYLEAECTYKVVEDSASAMEWSRINDQNRLRAFSDWLPYPDIASTIVFTIKENKPSLVHGITFSGLESLPLELKQKAMAEENISVDSNSVFNRSALVKEYIRVQELLEENGYPFSSRGQVVVAVDRVTHTVHITIPFKTGARHRFGETIIKFDSSGDMSSPVTDAAVRRQIVYEKDQWYSSADIRSTERGLYRMGIFDQVRVGIDTTQIIGMSESEREGSALPVVVTLRMRGSQDVTVGTRVGVGVATSVAFTGAYNNRNLLSGGEPFSFGGSYQILPVSQTVWDLGVQLGFPYWYVRNVSPLLLGLSFSQFKEEEKFNIRKTLISTSTIFDISQGDFPVTSAPTRLEYENVKSFFDSTYSEEIQERTAKPQENLIGSLDYIVDGTNNLLAPTRGNAWKFSIESGVPSQYIKLGAQFRSYQDMSNNGSSVFAFRAMGGRATRLNVSNPLYDVPTTRLYYGGGPTSLRAWPARSLLVSKNADSASPEIGGYLRLEGNIEYRFSPFKVDVERTTFDQIFSPLDIALFSDFGNVWDKNTDINLRNVALAAGFGFRYQLSILMIRLDFGLKIYDPAPIPILNPDGVVQYRPISPEKEGRWITERKFMNAWHIQFTLGEPFL